jgi:hypothetical protein
MLVRVGSLLLPVLRALRWDEPSTFCLASSLPLSEGGGVDTRVGVTTEGLFASAAGLLDDVATAAPARGSELSVIVRSKRPTVDQAIMLGRPQSEQEARQGLMIYEPSGSLR